MKITTKTNKDINKIMVKKPAVSYEIVSKVELKNCENNSDGKTEYIGIKIVKAAKNERTVNKNPILRQISDLFFI